MGRWVDIKPQTTIILKFLFLPKKKYYIFCFQIGIDQWGSKKLTTTEKTYILENSGK